MKFLKSIPLSFFVIPLYCVIIIFLLVSSIFRESPTFDEIAFAPAGYGFLTKHDFRLEPFNPPLTRELIALPTLFDGNAFRDKSFLLPRLVVVFFTICLGIVVYFFSKKLYGLKAAVFSLLLFTFNPEILTHGHYATTDLISTFFLLLSLFLYFLFRKNFTWQKLIIFSIIFGFTLSTKITTSIYLFISLILIFFLELKQKRNLIKFTYLKSRFAFLFIFFLLSSITLWSTYFFTFEPLLGYRFDKNRSAIQLAKNNPLINFALTQPMPLGSYMSSLKQVMRANYTTAFPKESFFFGTYSQDGFYGLLLLIVIFIKTPLPLLAVFIISLLYSLKKRYKDDFYLLISICVILASTFFTHVLLVFRYILPFFPLMIIFSSQIVNIKFKNKFFGLFLTAMIIWYVAGTLSSYPHYISFFNEIIGEKKNGYKYLVDANLDWGQGLIDLETYQKTNKIKNLQLAYFGTADPSLYGIQYERINDKSSNDKKKPVPLQLKNHVIAISATCYYYCGYYRDPQFRNKKPVDIVGGSILIFR